jgi:hypothetical protein
MNRRTFAAGLATLAATSATPAFAAELSDRAAIEQVIEDWYRAIGDLDDRAFFALVGPMAIIDFETQHCRNPASRRCDLVFSPRSLAAGGSLFEDHASRFDHTVLEAEIENRLARVVVRLRAWFRSQSGEYERQATSIFFLRKQDDGRWLVSAAREG